MGILNNFLINNFMTILVICSVVLMFLLFLILILCHRNKKLKVQIHNLKNKLAETENNTISENNNVGNTNHNSIPKNEIHTAYEPTEAKTSFNQFTAFMEIRGLNDKIKQLESDNKYLKQENYRLKFSPDSNEDYKTKIVNEAENRLINRTKSILLSGSIADSVVFKYVKKHENSALPVNFYRALEKKVKITNINISANVQSYTDQNKEPYNTTLNSCDCQDFKYRKDKTIPCKHMLRLILELSLLLYYGDQELNKLYSDNYYLIKNNKDLCDKIKSSEKDLKVLAQKQKIVEDLINTKISSYPWLANMYSDVCYIAETEYAGDATHKLHKNYSHLLDECKRLQSLCKKYEYQLNLLKVKYMLQDIDDIL